MNVLPHSALQSKVALLKHRAQHFSGDCYEKSEFTRQSVSPVSDEVVQEP